MWICPDKPVAANNPADKPIDLSFLDNIKEDDYSAESKPDGWRSVWDHNLCDLFSRNKVLLSHALKCPVDKEIVRILSLFKDVTLDGEYVTRRTNTDPVLYLFDIYGKEKQLLLNVPHCERRELLINIVKDRIGQNEKVKIIDHVYNNFKDFFMLQQKNPIMEGIVLKKRNSTLTGNRTNKSVNNNGWFKLKFR